MCWYIHIYIWNQQVTSVLIMILFLSTIDRKHIETHDLECLKESFGWVRAEEKTSRDSKTTKVLGSITSGKKHSECWNFWKIWVFPK